MATNYEILTSLTKRQMSAFILSLVNKDVSRYIDWNAWLGSEDPEPPYLGEAAFLKEGEEEIPCYLLEEKEEDGVRIRKVFIPGEKGTVTLKSAEAHFVRKESEPVYPSAPLAEIGDEELQEAAEESGLVLESLLDETEEEADELDQMINESMDLGFEEITLSEEEPAEEPEAEPVKEETEPERITDTAEPEEESGPERIIDAAEPAEESEPELIIDTEPEETEEDIPDFDFIAEPESEEEEEELPDFRFETEEEEEEEEELPVFTFDTVPEEKDETGEEEIPDFDFVPETKEDAAVLFEEEPEEPVQVLTLAEEREHQERLQDILFGDEESEEETAVNEPETEPAAEEPRHDADDDLDMDILGLLESEVLAADRAEDEVTSSIRFGDLRRAEPEQKPVKTAEKEEDEIVDFFEESDRLAARGHDYTDRGRIEMLKESLFDEDEEPPLNTGDLVFQETTAIQIDRNSRDLPEAADLDEAIAFAEVKIPDRREAQKAPEAEPEQETGFGEDADSFFERFRELAESEPDDGATDEFDLEELKKESSVLSRMAAGLDDENEEPERTPEEEERDFRSDTLAQLLIDKKKTSMLYDPNDPEDQELPTIAFSALNTEEDQMF